MSWPRPRGGAPGRPGCPASTTRSAKPELAVELEVPSLDDHGRRHGAGPVFCRRYGRADHGGRGRAPDQRWDRGRRRGRVQKQTSISLFADLVVIEIGETHFRSSWLALGSRQVNRAGAGRRRRRPRSAEAHQQPDEGGGAGHDRRSQDGMMRRGWRMLAGSASAGDHGAHQVVPFDQGVGQDRATWTATERGSGRSSSRGCGRASLRRRRGLVGEGPPPSTGSPANSPVDDLARQGREHDQHRPAARGVVADLAVGLATAELGEMGRPATGLRMNCRKRDVSLPMKPQTRRNSSSAITV